ncbi:MAG: glycosyltransferase family 2 protein [Clostridium sp.]|jgi:glycosyltransferase involved in cell wall biosynthesis|nr:glycosyltransferase family 2 protein [Clostridium sp.]
MTESNMGVEVLVAAMNIPRNGLLSFATQMRLDSNAVVINQCDRVEEECVEINGHTIRMVSFPERGVGRSRNEAILRSKESICLFSDQDIVYEDGYQKRIEQEFQTYPQIDMILFQVEVCAQRKTYDNKGHKRVHRYNCGRYPTYCFAIRRDSLLKSRVFFSLLFGGGALYSNGEDSLFIRDLIKKGIRVMTSPICIAREESQGQSTWFQGYHQRFFFDRGVLYHFLYGKLAKLFARRFLLAHSKTMCETIEIKQAYRYMKAGMKHAKTPNDHPKTRE